MKLSVQNQMNGYVAEVQKAATTSVVRIEIANGVIVAGFKASSSPRSDARAAAPTSAERNPA